MNIHQGLKKDSVLRKYVIGAHPIIQFFMDKLKISEIIGSYVRQDKRLKLSTEKALCLLIHNILSTPKPMYEIVDWLKPLDEEKVGLESGDSSFINDDRVGRALASFY